ncbi:MAG: coproporphyrinogen III oxidase [Bacteroidetes bacterium ADurb.Bin408]|nr:MAG: coproporphyrinogen III oxidase [Bacteroidetes bacterium ADurb.Bin408]
MYPWGHNRRFNAFPNYCVKVFGQRLQKVAVDAGFTCPNRDGTLSTEGCLYCNNDAFNPSYCNPVLTITEQLKAGIDFLNVRYKKAHKYLPYFQAYTNTYKPVKELEKLYNEALNFPGVVGLIIGTRPDCLDDETAGLLADLSREYFILLEFGVESCNDAILKSINRGHTFKQSADALKICATLGIKAGIHLIFGLPGDTRENMLAQTDIISSLPLHSIKMHQFQVVKGTKMETLYQQQPEIFYNFSREEYIEFVIDFVERLNPAIVIDRFAGEMPPRYLAGPSIMADKTWGFIRNDQLIQMIEKRMQQRETWQGRLYS